MVEYNTVNAKLSNSQLNKLKSAIKNNQGTILRMHAKMLSANHLPHELLLTARQITKLRNAIENNMSIWRISRHTSWSIIKNWITINKKINTHWIVLFVKSNELIYFDGFGVEQVPKEIKRFIRHKNTKTNIFRIQTDNSIMCGYFCIVFIVFANKTLIDFTSLFSSYDFKKMMIQFLIILNELIFHIIYISSVLGRDLHT